MMKNEKPGGHGERSVAVGTIDMAIWDLISKMKISHYFKCLQKDMVMVCQIEKFCLCCWWILLAKSRN